MDAFMSWMTDVFAPKMNKIARNPWIQSIQEAILAAMPVIFIGSFYASSTAFAICAEFPGFQSIATASRSVCWPLPCLSHPFLHYGKETAQ